MKQFYYDKKLKTTYLYLGFKHIFRINLMDTVVYNGKRYFVNNGTSKPVWDLIEVGTHNSIRVNQKEFKKEITFRNIKNAVKGTYRFHMQSWHRINMRHGGKIQYRG